MAMQRRDFFRLAAGAGLVCVGGLQGSTSLALGGGVPQAADGPYTGKFFVSFEAFGGWDATMSCDPKSSNRAYADGDIVTAGGIRYPNVGNNAAFFDKHAERLLIVNGIDTASNNHDTSRMHVWTGKLDSGLPSVAALVAGSHAPHLPLSFIAEGVFTETAGVVSPSRVDNAAVLQDLSFPNLVNPADPLDLRTYHDPATEVLIADYRRERTEKVSSQQKLPQFKAALDNLLAVRGGANELELLQAYLPDPLATDAVQRKIQIAVAAYKAGLAVSACFEHRNFDTHSDNDSQQIALLDVLLGEVDFLWEEAVRQGVSDKLVIAVGSDFSRSPAYNGGNGKDHWEITSMMFMGAGIEGNRTVGMTDDNQFAIAIDPMTLQPSSDGVRVTPEAIHKGLREVMEVSEELDAKYSLGDAELVGLFG
jgi:hypothetical protein